jgi:hypothetical protein
MNKLLVLSSLLLVAGCATTPVQPQESQVQVRAAQTRHYDTLDYNHTIGAVVATLLDLGFTIDHADYDVGTVTGERIWGDSMRMTVRVQKQDNKRLTVRANARDIVPLNQYGRAVTPPQSATVQTYQDFFMALDKSMFLARNEMN